MSFFLHKDYHPRFANKQSPHVFLQFRIAIGMFKQLRKVHRVLSLHVPSIISISIIIFIRLCMCVCVFVLGLFKPCSHIRFATKESRKFQINLHSTSQPNTKKSSLFVIK